MTVITTGNESRMLQEGLNAVWGDEYDSHVKQYDKIFDTYDSKKAFEQDQQWEGFAYIGSWNCCL